MGDELFKLSEQAVQDGVEWLRLFVEALGAVVIGVGVVLALVGLVRHALQRRGRSFTPIRLAFARYLTLALELQLAADILSTSVAPTWDRIGKLAAVAVIRTALNYFLSKEIELEQRQERSGPAQLGEHPTTASAAGKPASPARGPSSAGSSSRPP